MDYGKKIAYLRKSNGMTQEELGNALNVTYQAVSKWERGESLPDFTTMTQIAKIFNVPIGFFVEGGENFQEPAYNEPVYQQPVEERPAYIGICTECGKMLEEDEVHSTSPKIICKQCAERHRQENLAKKKEEADKRRWEREYELRLQRGHGFDAKLIVSLALSFVCYAILTILCFTSDFSDNGGLYGALLFLVPVIVFAVVQAIFNFINDLRDLPDGSEKYTRNLSLIIGGTYAAVNLISFLVLYLVTSEFYYLFVMILGVICSFTFVSQFMWGSIVKEIFTAGGFTFKLPGFIFSLNIESILLMIVLKVVLGIIAALIFIVTTILFALVAILGSVFTFIPCIIYKSAKDKTA